jgi:O-antigen ligase
MASLRRALQRLSATNRVWTAATLLAPPIAGSGAAALCWLASGLGVISLAAHAGRLAIPRGVMLSAAAFALFFVAEALAGLANWRGTTTFGAISANLAFLGLLPFWHVLRADRAELLGALRAAAPWFAIAAAALALAQQFALGFRPQGGAGNPGVFAATCAVLLVFAVDAFAEAWRNGANRAVATAGVLAAALAVLASGSRALWPALAFVPAILLAGSARIGRSGLLAAVVALGVAIAAAWPTIGNRIALARNDLELARQDELKTPTGKRLVIWRVALDAIAEKPLLGHGPDSPRPLMEERSAAVAGFPVIYSHFHNLLLNEMVRAGLAGTTGLLAMFAVPLGVAFAARRRDETAASAFRLLAACQAALLCSGMLNILFGHDILDALFVATTAVCLYLSAGAATEKP